MTKVLVTYITHSGTTRDVAEAIAEEITKTGVEAELLECSQVKNTYEYAAVVMGAPMIVGWHRDALKYLKTHHAELAEKPLALFLMGMSLTESTKPELAGIDLHLDQKLLAAPKNPGRIGFKESFTTIKHYLQPILKAAPKSLAAVGFFGGRMDMYRLKWFEVIFVMLVVGAKPGEKRNWPDIRTWATSLPVLLKLGIMIPIAMLEEHLKHMPEDILDIVMEVRDIVERLCPEAIERLDRNGIVYFDANRGGPVKAGICQIVFKQDYVSLEFIHGVFLPDPAHLLRGNNLYKKQVLLGAFNDVPWDEITALITASAHFDPASLYIKGSDGKTPLERFQDNPKN